MTNSLSKQLIFNDFCQMVILVSSLIHSYGIYSFEIEVSVFFCIHTTQINLIGDLNLF